MEFEKNLKEILESNKSWKKEFNKTYGFIKDRIGIDNSISKIVKIKYKDFRIKMPLAHYAINLIMWRPCIKLGIKWNENMVFDCSNITQDTIKTYLDTIFVRPVRNSIDIRILNLEMAKVIEKLKLFCEDFGIILGISYNYYQLYELIKENPHAMDLFYTKIPEGLQQSEIEDFLHEKLDELVDILKNSNTGFAALLNAGTGINIGQLQELMVAIGNKPDLFGNTYPVPINTNIMFGGLSTPAQYVLDSSAGKKALIMNKKYTGKSGYFSRKLNLLNIDTVLDQHTDDCGTKKLLKFKVRNKEFLKRIEGRYYKTKPDSPFLKCVSIDDEFLIGKTIWMRSPGYCLGDKICKKCYGELYNINREINIGMIAATIINRNLMQNLLSSKHLLKTHSKTIEFSKEFYKYLNLYSNTISINDKYENAFIEIEVNDIFTDLMDECEDAAEEISLAISEEVSCEKIYIVDKGKRMKIEEKGGMAFKCNEYTRNLINKYYNSKNIISIPFKDINGDVPIFTIDVANHELTKSLIAVKNLLEKESHCGCNSYDELIDKFNQLLIDGKIYAHSVHAEIVCRNLLRSTKDILQRPDFSKKDEKYEILTLQRALMKNPSPIITLSYERLDDQLKNALTYRKFKPSILDKLFMKKYKQYFNSDIEDYKFNQAPFVIDPEEDD